MAGKNSQGSNALNTADEKKKSGAKNSPKQSKRAYIEETENDVSFGGEITAWVIGACMLILELANFGLCGAVANVSKFFFGVFGAIQYIIPLAILFSVFFLHINEYKKRAVQKVVFGFIVILCIGMIIQMLSGINVKYDFGELFDAGISERTGGGIVCGTLAFILHKLVGAVGTYIIIILAIIICVVLVAEVSVIDALGNLFGSLFSDEEDDDEYEDSRNDREYKTNRKRKNKNNRDDLNPEFQQIIIEDYSDGLNNEKISEKDRSNKGNIDKTISIPNKKKKVKEPDKKQSNNSSILESIEVRPDNPDQNLFTINGNHPSSEDIHEIVMDIPVNLPGENMDALYITESTSLPITENAKSASQNNNKANDNILSGTMKFEDEIVSDKENIKPVKKKRKQDTSGYSKAKTSTDDTDNNTGTISGNTLSESEKEAIMNMENKTAKAEKNMSAKEVGNSDSEYHFPPLELLQRAKSSGAVREDTIRENAVKLQEVLKSFGVNVTMTNCSCGPSVTRYEMVPEQGVKVSKITGLADDIMMNLAAQSIRIEAPIPGKSAVGIEIPNGERTGVGFRELIDTEKFIKHPSKIAFAVGKDIEGNVVVEDIAKMPHLLIAGATGSGKSVCTNTLIMSILYKARPDEVKLILVDPKQVELKVYNGIPHLLTPVVTDPKKAAGALNWAVAEMTKRYQMFSECNVRNIQGYNEKVKEVQASGDVDGNNLTKMPQIVIIVDELADLMMVAKAEVEEAIVRLAQLARAAGIHLVIATQRPSVDVVTGLIKANVPSRIALSVSSGIDSRTIIDTVGAEKLLGNGDMLFYPTMYPKPLRVQGAYISDDEVVNVVEYLKVNNGETTYSEEMTNQITSSGSSGVGGSLTGDGGSANDRDDYFIQAGKFIIEKNKASIGMLQRMFKIGFNRAARIMDQLCEAGVVGPEVGTKPREVLMTEAEFEEYVDEYF